MAVINSATAKTLLVRQGFRVNTESRYTQALRDFQGGWNLGNSLGITGTLTQQTSDALLASERRRSQRLPTLSAHFSYIEFQCKCGGKFAACRRIAGEGLLGNGKHVLRTVAQALEKTRELGYPKGMKIASGYRCDGHNATVGGAASSQHRWGAAVDLDPAIDKDILRTKGWFSGLGFQGKSDLIRHADRRDISGVNPTRGSTTHPTLWVYS